jgi:hypothetical protein
MRRKKISKRRSKKVFARAFKKNARRRNRQRKVRSLFRGGYRL